MIEQISVETKSRTEFVNITHLIEPLVKDIKEGVVTIFCPHTTAGITINENADPDVLSDLTKKFNSMVPENEGYAHSEGNSDSHVKSFTVPESCHKSAAGHSSSHSHIQLK